MSRKALPYLSSYLCACFLWENHSNCLQKPHTGHWCFSQMTVFQRLFSKCVQRISPTFTQYISTPLKETETWCDLRFSKWSSLKSMAWVKISHTFIEHFQPSTVTHSTLVKILIWPCQLVSSHDMFQGQTPYHSDSTLASKGPCVNLFEWCVGNLYLFELESPKKRGYESE